MSTWRAGQNSRATVTDTADSQRWHSRSLGSTAVCGACCSDRMGVVIPVCLRTQQTAGEKESSALWCGLLAELRVCPCPRALGSMALSYTLFSCKRGWHCVVWLKWELRAWHAPHCGSQFRGWGSLKEQGDMGGWSRRSPAVEGARPHLGRRGCELTGVLCALWGQVACHKSPHHGQEQQGQAQARTGGG